ncbi:MAG: heme o synthase [Actinomycetota bacterium]|nr:heme o synthase [Actinomycetota bacterium]
MPDGAAPGLWLRLAALAGAAAVLAAVISGAVELGTGHQVLSALALPPLLAVLVASRVAYRALFPLAAAAFVLFGAASLVVAPGIHLALSALAFAAALVSAAACFRGRRAPAGPWRDYVALTKPRIMSLLLLTGACGMVVGAGGVPRAGLFVAAIAGLALACGGASALNHYLDRDIDRLMGARTSSRPVAAGRVPAPYALEFGLALSALSFVLLASTVNVLAAALALAGNLFYVVVYTRWLKRSTPQNIVIGGAAGAVPPLVGWAAATGDLTLPALALFLIVFFWTPPHFWALALLLRRNYETARVPMLPVVRGDRATARQVVVYTLLLLPVTLLPYALGTLGEPYLGAAVALGAAFLYLAWRLARDLTRARAARVFHFSLAYLALLFLAMAIDPLIT